MHLSDGLERRQASCEQPTPTEKMPLRPRTDDPTDLIAEAHAVEWGFATWCYVSGYDAADPDVRNMFECLLAYAKREGRAGLH